VARSHAQGAIAPSMASGVDSAEDGAIRIRFGRPRLDADTESFLAAVDDNLWSAVERPLPDNAGIEALEVIRAAAWLCFEIARHPTTPCYDTEACTRRVAVIDARLRALRAI